MTNRSKYILVSVFLLALLLVAGIAGNLWQAQPTRAQTYVYSFLIILSTLAVPFLHWLRVRRHGYEKVLLPEYLERYEAAKEVIGQTPLVAATQQNILGDVLDLLMTAQKTGRSAEGAMPDPAGYATEAIRACGSHRRTWWSQLPAAVLDLICFVLVAQLLYWLEDTRKSMFIIQQGYDLLFFYLLLAFVLLPWLSSDWTADRAWRSLLPLGCGLLYVVLAAIMRYFTSQYVILQTIMNGGVNVIPNPLVLAILLVMIPLLLLIRLWLPRGAGIPVQGDQDQTGPAGPAE